jgi:hypothetical protein
MRELWLEMWHDMHPDSKSKFVTKGMLHSPKSNVVPWFDSWLFKLLTEVYKQLSEVR